MIAQIGWQLGFYIYFIRMSHTFLHIFNFLPLTTLLMSPFCFCLLLGFCHKWNEGRGASLVKSLARSYNVHSSCIHTREMRMKTCFESSGWLAASFVTTLLMFVSNNGPGMFCPIVLVCFVEFMSKVFLKFWVEQSHLMDWNEKNGGTFPQPFSQESVWMVVDDRKQKPLKSSSSTSSFISLCLRREEEMCSPWNFDELSFARDLQLVGARENVYKGWWGGNIQIFTVLAFEGERDIPYSHRDGTCVWVRGFLPHNIGVGVRSKKRQRKTGSGNKKCFL